MPMISGRLNGRRSGESDYTGIMEALTDPNIYIMGVCGNDDDQLETVKRRAELANLFGAIVMVTISKKPNLTRIQQEIAHQLGFSFQGQEQRTRCCVFPSTSRNQNAVTENARQLCDRIRTEPKILFILRDISTRLDLTTLGIPFGADHQGCKLIFTSQREEILSNHMNTQRIFKF